MSQETDRVPSAPAQRVALLGEREDDVRLLDRPAWGATFLVFFYASTARADVDTATSTLSVEVRGRRPGLADPTATVSRLDRAALDRARVEGATLPDLVDRLPGARTLDDGGPGHARRLTVRGGSAAQAQLVVDGLALATPFATGLDVGVIGAEAISEATLVRGGAGALLGDGALSGALLLETRAPHELAPLAVTLHGGTLGRFGLGVAAATTRLALTAEVERSSGRFDYVSRLDGLPDVERTRENNDASGGRASARGTVALAGGRLDLLGGAAVRENGLPGFETQADREARERRASGLARAAWRRGVGLGDGGALELVAHAAVLDVAFRDEAEAARTQFVASGGEATLAWTLAVQRLRLAVGGSVEASDSTEHGTPQRGRAHLLVADTLHLGSLSVLGALRAQVVGDSGVIFLPRLGLTWTATTGVTMSLAGGRSSRAPAIDELYHPTTRGFAGNPGLRPEAAWEGELSLRLTRWGPLSASIAGFVRRVEDGIVYVNRNAFVIRPENLGAATVVGGELTIDAELVLGPITWAFAASGSLTHSTLDATDAPLPTAPPAACDAELRASWWPPGWARLELFTRAGATASTTANLSGTITVDAYARWDAGAALVLADRWSVAVEVSNLLDDRGLESVFKLPLPGRAVLATVRVEAG